MLLPALVFAAVLVIVLGFYFALVVRPEAETQKGFEKRLQPEEQEKKAKRLSVPRSEREQPTIQQLSGLQTLIDQSGLPLSVPSLLFLCWFVGFILGFAAYMATSWMYVALTIGGLGALVPYLWVRRTASSRMWKFEEQFPEAIDLIARALRAGHALPTGLQMVADELPPPVGPEFKLLYDRQNFGMALTDALRAFAQRVPVLDARFFVTAVLTQRETGGDLSGILDALSAVIRERFKVKRQIRVVSAHGRMTAGVLMALPPAVAVAQSFLAPANIKTLTTDPLGIKMLAGALVLQLLGMAIISRIVKVEYDVPLALLIGLIGTFLAVALASGSVLFFVLERRAPARTRLQAAAAPQSAGLVASPATLMDSPHKLVLRVASFLPKSPKEMSRLQKRLVRAGYHSLRAAVVFSLAELTLPIGLAGAVIWFFGWQAGWLYALLAAGVGYMIPGLVLARMIEKRRKAISNALPDALDLLIVCLRAGSSLDQAIAKATAELSLAYPALAEEFRMLGTETRAGKPRVEAFKNLDARTKNEDIRALVTMLVQTDRFGTSVAQALATLSEVSRTKRRQRAEEKAAKIGVKLVFPLVFCLFPALFVATAGAAFIVIVRFFS